MSRSAKQAASSVGSSAGTIKVALSGISGGLKGAWSSLGLFGKIGLVTTAIGLVVSAVQKYKAYLEELRIKAEENSKAFIESQGTLDDYGKRIAELKDALDKGTLSENEAYQAKKELYEIQGKLNETYGDAASGIDLVNGKLDEQIAKLGELAVLDAQRYLNENDSLIARATREMTKTLGGEGSWITEAGSYIGMYYENLNEDTERLKEILQKYSNIETDDMGDGSVRIRFVGDATQAKSVLNDLMTDLRIANQEFSGSSDLFQGIFDGVSSVYDEADAIIEKYQTIYETAMRARMIEEASSARQKTYGSEGNQQTAAKWLDDYTNAIQKYNNALSSGDTGKIAEARNEFENLDSVIQSLLADGSGLGFFAPMFSEVRDALNESAIAAQNFRETMNRSQEADYLRRSGMTQTQFAEAFVSGLKADQTSSAVKKILEEYASQYGIEFSQMTTEQVEAVAGYLADMGILIHDKTSEIVSTAVGNVKKASEDTMKAISGISSVQKVLASQSAGSSISLSDFTSDDMKEYASAIEYVNGVYQLNSEKVNELVKAKSNLVISQNEENKALAQAEYLKNAREIEKYRKELELARANNDGTSDAIEENIRKLNEQNDGLLADINSYDLMNASIREATSAYQNWLNAKGSSQSGDMFDGALAAIKQIDDTLNNAGSDLFGRVGRSDYKAAVDFIVPDSVDAEDSAAVNAYMDSIKEMFTFDKDGNRTGLNIGNFIQKSLDAGLIAINDAGTAYEIAGGKTMEDFANGLGLSLPLVRAMFGELEEFGAKFDWADEATQTFGDMAVAATEAADALREKLGEKYQLSIDVSDAEQFPTVTKQVEHLNKTISDMQNAIKQKEVLHLDSGEVASAEAIIRAAVTQKQILLEPDVMKVDTSVVEGKLGSAIETLQRFQEAKNALEMADALGLDTTDAQAELDAATRAVQELDANITSPKVLNIDTTSVETISESLQNLTADIIVKAGIDDSAVIGYKPDNKSATVTYGVDRRAVDAFNPPNLTRYVTYKPNPEGGITDGTSGNGNLHGSANAYGSARLRGDWRARGGRSLVGELGREIIVDPNTGRWYTVGDNGAEFVNIPDGAIVFNHLQSDALLENGRVSGRGRAMALGSAFVTGSIPIGIGGGNGGGSNYRPPSSGANSSVEDNYSKELETFDWIEVAIDRIERIIDRFSKTASSAFKSLATRVSATGDEISMITQEISLQKRAYDKYMSAAEAVSLSADLKQLVRNGAIDISQYDQDTQKLINDYKELYEKALDCSASIDDLHESLAQLYKDNFDNVQKDFENKLSLMEKRASVYNTKIDKLEEQGYLKNATYYKQLQNTQKSSIGVLNQELQSLQNALTQAIGSGEIEEGSEAWYEMQFAIEDTKAAIEEAELAVIEYDNAIREIGWEYFDYAQERIGQIASEADFLLNLLDGKDMYDENGNLSDAGIAANGVHAEKYGIYMAQADKYAEEIKRINKELANDPNNTKLIKRRDELVASQRDAILAAKSEKEAMVDLAKNGINAELEAVKKLIDAYTESLDSAKDLYDYQKKIADKTEKITDLEKQLAAYQNDLSEETRSKIQKIQIKLEDAKNDLKETEYERLISDSKKMLDDLYSEYESVLNSRFDDIDATFEKMIALTNENFVSINEYLSQIANGVGYTISDDTNSVWSNGGGVNGFVSVYGEDITSKLTATGIVVENIFGVLEAIAKQNGVPFTGKSYASGGLIDYTGVANVHGSANKPEMVLNSDDTKNFIKLRDILRDVGMSSQIGSPVVGLPGIAAVSSNNGVSVGEINITIPIEKVEDYNDFVNQLRSDSQFEKLVQEITIGRLAGKSKLSKNKFNW